jgi:hypothetical protein
MNRPRHLHPALATLLERLQRLYQKLTAPIALPALTSIVVAASLATGLAYLLQGRFGFVFGSLCAELAYFFGPPLCGFLFVVLFHNIIRHRGGHPWLFLLGAVFGFGTFYVWLHWLYHLPR